MKKTILKISTLLLIVGCVLITQDSNAEITAPIKDTIPPAKTYVLNERKYFVLSFKDSLPPVTVDTLTGWQKFKAVSEQRIDSNENRIAVLKTNMADKMKDSYEKTIADLEQRNELIKKRLADYKENSEENPEPFKQKIDKDISAITSSILRIKLK